MTAGGYVELHAHSAYSFLDGASLPAELVQRSAELRFLPSVKREYFACRIWR